jgi:hypothetical protein
MQETKGICSSISRPSIVVFSEWVKGVSLKGYYTASRGCYGSRTTREWRDRRDGHDVLLVSQ